MVLLSIEVEQVVRVFGYILILASSTVFITYLYTYKERRHTFFWWLFQILCMLSIMIFHFPPTSTYYLTLYVGLSSIVMLGVLSTKSLLNMQEENAKKLAYISNLLEKQESYVQQLGDQAVLLEEKNSELIAQTEALEGARRQLDNQLQEAEAARREIEALHAAERQRSAYERFLGRYERLMRESYSLPLEEFLYSLFVYWEEDIGVVGGLLYGVERGELRVLKGFRLGGRERKGQGPLEIMLMSPRVWAVGPLPSGSICLGTSEGGYEPRWAVYVPFVMTGTKELTGLGELYFYEEPSEDTLDKLRDLQERIGMYLWIRRHAGEVLQPQA
ncbi:MAG: coiled-coil domain-containing protein [Bacteroidia bacterium]